MVGRVTTTYRTLKKIIKPTNQAKRPNLHCISIGWLMWCLYHQARRRVIICAKNASNTPCKPPCISIETHRTTPPAPRNKRTSKERGWLYMKKNIHPSLNIPLYRYCTFKHHELSSNEWTSKERCCFHMKSIHPSLCKDISRALDLGNVAHEVNQAVAVAPLVVVPGHHLNKGGVQHDAGLGIEHRRARVVYEVLTNHLLRHT